MTSLNWRDYCNEFEDLVDDLILGACAEFPDLDIKIRAICRNDPAAFKAILGVDTYLVTFLEFLFFKAEGPYSSQFAYYAEIIRILFASSEPLRFLLNHNAADAIGNMILNKRGRLKFEIADHLELMIILDMWVRFGLIPVSQRQVYEAVMKKSTISRRIMARDPGVILRLVEVFPEYRKEFCPDTLTKEDLIRKQADIQPLPSQRRYHHLYDQIIRNRRDIAEVIREEEQRILPIQVKRNTFLGYLVKKAHQETCQICDLIHESQTGSIITVHHITPLSEGGKDIARNMLVVCRHHHQAIHAGEIQVRCDNLIEIRCRNDILYINPKY